MLKYNPKTRITPAEALLHPFFSDRTIPFDSSTLGGVAVAPSNSTVLPTVTTVSTKNNEKNDSCTDKNKKEIKSSNKHLVRPSSAPGVKRSTIRL